MATKKKKTAKPASRATSRKKPTPKKTVSKRERPSPSRKAPARPVAQGTVSRVTETLATALGGVTGATLELSSTALSAVGTSVRAAQQIGGEVVKATAAAAAESLEAAQRAWRSGAKPGGAKPGERSPGRAPSSRPPSR